MDVIFSIDDDNEPSLSNSRLGDQMLSSIHVDEYVFRPHPPIVHEPIVIRGTGNFTL